MMIVLLVYKCVIPIFTPGKASMKLNNITNVRTIKMLLHWLISSRETAGTVDDGTRHSLDLKLPGQFGELVSLHHRPDRTPGEVSAMRFAIEAAPGQ